MNDRRLVWAIAGLGILVAGYAGYRLQKGDGQAGAVAPAASVATGRSDAAVPSGPANAAGPITVEAVRVGTGALVDDLQAVGSIQANESVVLRPEIAGRVARIEFREGQVVRKDVVLVALDDSVPRAELAQAEAQLALAASNFDRTQDLARQNFVSASAQDQASSTLKVQESARALAQTKLAKLTIRAPFDGVVGVRKIAVGDYVKEGQDMVPIEDTSTVKVDFRIPERYLAQVRVGQKLVMETDALAQRQFAATVELIDPQVDAGGRSVLVRGRVSNPGGLLRPGMFARVRLVFEERNHALTVPEEAVVPAATPQGSANFVYRVLGSGESTHAKRTQVELGLRRAGRVEVRSGLGGDDLVVTAGQIKLRGDDAPVRVLGGAGAEAVASASKAKS